MRIHFDPVGGTACPDGLIEEALLEAERLGINVETSTGAAVTIARCLRVEEKISSLTFEFDGMVMTTSEYAIMDPWP